MSNPFNGLLHRWFIYLMAALVASLGVGVAHATLPEWKLPGAVIQDLAEQPGVPLGQFELPVQLVNLGGRAEGEIRFDVLSASMGRVSALRLPATRFASQPGGDTTVRVRPGFEEEGMYRVRADVKADSFQVAVYFWLLLKDGRVYYSSDTGNIVSAMAAHQLRNHAQLQALQRKAATASVQKKQRSAGETPAVERPINELLSAEDLKQYQQIWRSEADAIFSTIPRRAEAAGSKRLAKATATALAQGDVVTLKFRWPVDASYTQFLPLEGARIAVVNLAQVQDPSDPEQGKFASGRLDANGEFKFTVPVNDLKYRVWLIGEHEKFKVQVHNSASGLSEALRLRLDQVTSVDIIPGQPPFGYSSEYAQAWSVFQAMYELSEHAVTATGAGAVPQLSVVRTNFPMPGNGAAYDPNDDSINVDALQSYYWDVMAHEYGHAISRTNQSIIGVGGAHTLGNQYDNGANTATFQNKQQSNRLALEEAFASWFATSYWKSSKYANRVPHVGDDRFDGAATGGGTGGFSLEDSGTLNGVSNVYGEDSEAAVARFMWDITDAGEEPNARAGCSKYCKESLQVPLQALMQNAITGKNLDGFNGFYQRAYQVHVGSAAGALDNVGAVSAESVEKALQIGAVSAEFGMGANINTTYNPDPFRDIDAPTRRNLDSDPVVLRWAQHKTGSMPGLDRFELLFYSEALDQLLVKLDTGTLTTANNSYQYVMPRAQVQAVINALQKTGYKPEYKVVLVVKGTASGSGAAGGVVQTGPYYGNAEVFNVQLGDEKKFATIAVDSSGSNVDTDPSNLRIQAAHSMLAKMATRNANIMTGTEQGRLLSVAALDFDSAVSVIADFSDPKVLADGNAFQGIDSNGGTDIAAAVRRSTAMLTGMRPTPNPPVHDANTPRMYMLTDMDNNDGPAAVQTAIREATAANVQVHLGHLTPVTTKSAASGAQLHGEPAKKLTKVAERLDGMIAAILEGGGSYTSFENPASQAAWVDLMDELSQSPPFTRTRVNLPLDVKFYGFAQNTGTPEPTFVFTAPRSGQVTITMDGKGSFVPDLQVGGVGGQTSLGRDLYALPFNVVQGQTYQISINEPGAAAGLYSIVLRQTLVASPSLVLAAIADVEEGSAPQVSGTTAYVADGSIVRLTFTSLTKAVTTVDATITANAFSASGPADLPKGSVTVTAEIAGSGIAPQTQTFTVQAKAAPPAQATPVPVDHPLALGALAVWIAGLAARRQRRVKQR